jgi:predicted Ser/Thr protein kinase
VGEARLPDAIGRYDVIDRLGFGGMGVVYRGRDRHIGRDVAIKVLRVSERGMRERFQQEARSAGSLKHRNIVTVHDVGEHEGQPFIVMEYVEGRTIADYIRGHEPLTLDRKLELLESLAAGLDYAHRKGIVHRDIKPTNLMIDQDGVLKILDFGIAHLEDSSLTQSGVIMGTLNYMSPEQIDGQPVDPRSDIFAVGLVMYELLSYRQAFAGDSMRHVLNAITRDTPPSLAQICPGGIDASLEAIVARALEKDPARRYQTLSKMGADISSSRARLRLGSNDETITLPPPEGPRPTRRPADVSRDRLAERRTARVQELLESARRALEEGDEAAAIDACEQAMLIHPDDARVQDMLAEARSALEKSTAVARIFDARASLDQDDLDRAAEFIAEALALDPESDEARELEAVIDDRKRQRAEEQARARAIAVALAHARDSIKSGNPESAIRAASEILIHDPGHPEAHELSREALALIESRRQRERLDREAESLVKQQRREFAAGRHREAIAALDQATAHALVTAALSEMRVELEAIERKAREAEERRRQEQADEEQRQQALQRWLASQMELAKRAVDAQQFVDAIEILEQAQRRADDPALAALLTVARAGENAARAAVARQQRARALLQRAGDEAGAGRFEEGLALVDSALELMPNDADAVAARVSIVQSIETRRRQQALDEDADRAVQAARRDFDEGRHDEAFARLRAFQPGHAAIARALRELNEERDQIARRQDEARRAKITRVEQVLAQAREGLRQGSWSAAESAIDEGVALDPQRPEWELLRSQLSSAKAERLRRSEHEQNARGAVAAARRQFDEGDRKGALSALEGFEPAHDLVSETLKALRVRSAELDRLELAAEQERLRSVARQKRIEEGCGRAAREIQAASFTEALTILSKLEAAEGPDPAVAALVQRARDGQSAADAEERDRQHAEANRLEQVQWVSSQMDEARAALDLQASRAVQILERARARLANAPGSMPESPALEALLGSARVRVRVNEIIADARRGLKKKKRKPLAAALEKIEEALALEPNAPGVRELESEIRTAIARLSPAADPQETVFAPPVEGALSGADEFEDGDQAVEHAAGAAPFDRRALIGGLVALSLALVGGLYYFYGPSRQAVPSGPTTLTTITVPPSQPPSAPPSIPPPSIDVPAAPNVDQIVAAARSLMRSGNLIQAADEVTAALEKAPASVPLRGALLEIVEAAAKDATVARQAADRARVTDRPGYRDAAAHVQSASRLRGGSRLAPAVREFEAGARLFREVAQLVPPVPVTTVAVATTTVPVQPLSTIPATSTMTSTAVTSLPTSSVPATTSVPVQPATIDRQTAQALLAEYTRSYRAFNVPDLRRIFPGFTNTAVRRLDLERSNFTYCEYAFSNMNVTGSPTTARVEVDAIEACKPKTAQPPIQNKTHEIFDLQKSAAGTWIIIRQSTSM